MKRLNNKSVKKQKLDDKSSENWIIYLIKMEKIE